MGKHANARRKELFAKLEEAGKIPVYRRRPKPRPPVEKKPSKHPCCLIKYENNLPMGFRKCYGCPLDSPPEGE